MRGHWGDRHADGPGAEGASGPPLALAARKAGRWINEQLYHCSQVGLCRVRLGDYAKDKNACFSFIDFPAAPESRTCPAGGTVGV